MILLTTLNSSWPVTGGVSSDGSKNARIVMTARDIVEKAFRRARVLGRGKALSAEDAQEGLFSLQTAFAELDTGNMTLTEQQAFEYPLVIGQATYLFGDASESPAPDITTPSPIEIEAAGILDLDGRETPIEVLSLRKWAAISDKAKQGKPSAIRYEDRRRIYVNPVPDAAYSLRVYGYFLSACPGELSEQINMPVEWANLVVLTTTRNLAGEYGKSLKPEFAAALQAAQSSLLTARSNVPDAKAEDMWIRMGSASVRGSGYTSEGWF